MSLHLVFSTAGLSAALQRSTSEDQLVLMGDAVYACAGLSQPAAALLEDARVRGVALTSPVQGITYQELAALCTQHNPIVSWRD